MQGQAVDWRDLAWHLLLAPLPKTFLQIYESIGTAKGAQLWPRDMLSQAEENMLSFMMAFLLSSAPSVLAFAKRSPPNCFNKRWMKVIQSAGWCSCNLVRRSSSFTDTAENDPPAIHGVRNRSADLLPYFPIYYNDCYEVELPRGHRFPMEKYRKVRMALQNKILSSGDAKKQVDCGEFVNLL